MILADIPLVVMYGLAAVCFVVLTVGGFKAYSRVKNGYRRKGGRR